MTDTLFIGDYAYSSWSLRAWLLFRRFDIPAKISHVDFFQANVVDQLDGLHPAKTVPTVQFADGAIVWDSLAIAEELATRHPAIPLWPAKAELRATARALSAEMHSGFAALRENCPMNLRVAYSGVTPTDATVNDLTRLETVWSFALNQSGGPWLCGAYSIADAFFAPVAARIATYDLPVGEQAAAYVASHLADPAFRRWRAMGFAKGSELPWYARDHDTRDWPGPAIRPARPLDSGTAENDACPYSGLPVTHLMEMEGRVFGFCNAFCRDKTVADPEAWPAFMALV